MPENESQIPQVKTPRELLGHVSCPSAILVVLDGGLMHLWQHDRPVDLQKGQTDDITRSKANAAVDLEIEGPEAEQAGKLFDRQWNPHYLFDIPSEHVPTITRDFEKLVRDNNLIARLVQLPERITHRTRIDLALDYGRGIGEVPYHGGWAVALAGIPAHQSFPIYAQRMSNEQDKHRWRQVFVEFLPNTTPTQTQLIGHVLVDEARFLFTDADAMGSWNHLDALDGLADYVFWGDDAQAVAKDLGARSLAPEDFGWRDLPVDEALELGAAVQRLRDKRKLKLRGDFRPHSHHYLAMEQVRSSPTESGTITLAGAQMCLMMTTWGDGAFDVYRDLDPAGNLVRLRIDVGSDTIVRRQRRLEQLWFGEFAKFAFVSRRIMQDREPVRWMYREKPDNAQDSGWRLYCGDEDQDYCDNPDNVEMIPLRDLIRLDPTLEAVLSSPQPAAFQRRDANHAFAKVEDWEPPEEQ